MTITETVLATLGTIAAALGTTTGAKLVGSSMGSSIAVTFKPANDNKLIWAKRFILGTIIGFVSAPIIIDLFGWKHSYDYWLASSTMGGLLGYMILQVVLSDSMGERLDKIVKGVKK